METQRETQATVASYYDDMPFSQLLFRYLWPFWLFRDATHGDMLARAAAYRHNQSMRVYLPGYMMRWSFGSVLLLGLTLAFDAWSQQVTLLRDCFLWIAAGSGMAFACMLCLMLELVFVYLYLSHNEF